MTENRSASRAVSSRVKAVLAKMALLLVSLLLSFGSAEMAWRLVLASNTALGELLRNPTLYGDPFSDDFFWLLRQHWQGDQESFRPPQNPHPILGWHSAKINADFSHVQEKGLRGRRPVLLYGDSFAQGMPGVDHFQRMLNHDREFEDFSRDHFMLNYGVGGYGLDQIYLMFENSIDRFEDPFVIFSLMTFDLDRSMLSVRIGQKPYFELEDGQLTLRGVPVDKDPENYFSSHPPRVGSYVLRRLWRFSRYFRFARIRQDARLIAEKKRINGAILDAAISELESRQLDYVIFVFHAGVELKNEVSWRSDWLGSKIEAHKAPYLWSYDILRSQAAHLSFDEIFDPAHVHPTSAANRIMARAMAEKVMAAQDTARETSGGL